MDVAILTGGGAIGPAAPPAPPAGEPVLDEAFASLVDAGAFETPVVRPRVDEPRLGETPPLLSLLPLLAGWQPAAPPQPALDADATGTAPVAEGEAVPEAIADGTDVAVAVGATPVAWPTAGEPGPALSPAPGATENAGSPAATVASAAVAPPAPGTTPVPTAPDLAPERAVGTNLSATTSQTPPAAAATGPDAGAPANASTEPPPAVAQPHREPLPAGARGPDVPLPPTAKADASVPDVPVASVDDTPAALSAEPRAENEFGPAPAAVKPAVEPAPSPTGRMDAVRQSARAALARALSAVRGDDEASVGRVVTPPLASAPPPAEVPVVQAAQIPLVPTGVVEATVAEPTAAPAFTVQAVSSGTFGFSRDGARDGQHEWYGRRAGAPFAMMADPLTSGVATGPLGAPFTATATAQADAPAGRQAEVPDLTPQFVRSLRMQWQGGLGEAKFLLNPEHLGEVSVQLRVGPDGVTAGIQSASPLVRGWIATHADELREALAAHGLDLRALVVDEPPDERRQHGQRQPRDEDRDADAGSLNGEGVDFASLL